MTLERLAPGILVLFLLGALLISASFIRVVGRRADQHQFALSFDGQHVLALEYGALCLPSLPRSACISGVRRQTVQVSYRTPEQRRVLVFVTIEHQKAGLE